MSARPAVGWESHFIATKAYIQFALSISDKSFMPKLLNKIDKTVAALHYGTDGKQIFRTHGSTPIYKLPDNVTDLGQLNEIMYQKYTRPLDHALASIGTNKDTIVLNINHLAADGGYLHNLFEFLKTDEDINYIPSIIPTEKVFEKEINEYNGSLPLFPVADPSLTRAIPQDQLNYHTAYGMFTNNISIDAKTLMTSKINGKIKNLTEYYWASVILSVSAFNNKLKNTGIPTCINLRQYLNKSDFNIGNCFSHVIVSTHVTKDDDVKTLMDNLRQDFNNKYKLRTPIGELKSLKQGSLFQASVKGLVPDISLNGTFKMEKPFKDMRIDLGTIDGSNASILCFIGYSIVNGNQNTLFGKLRHPSGDISDNEAKTLLSSFHYGLQNISPIMKIGEVFDMLRDHQMNFKKSLQKEIQMMI